MEHIRANYRKLYKYVCEPQCKNDIKYRSVQNSSSKHDMKILGKGGQGVVYLYDSDRCGKSAIKISKNIAESQNELFFLKNTKQLVDKKISPHFVYNYCSFAQEKEIYILNEYADGTLEDWLSLHHTEQEWFSMLFQIIHSLYIFQKKIYAVHNDLKPKNILFRKIAEGKFKYLIEDNIYIVPTYGNLFMMADYGKSESLLQKKNNVKKIESMIKINTDYDYIKSLPRRILVSAAQNKYKTLENLLDSVRDSVDNHFKTYMEHEKNKINRDLEKYPQKIKDKMLLRSMIYYMVEKNLLGKTDIEEDFFYEKYPPVVINEIINCNLSMEDVLQFLGKKLHNNNSTEDLLDTFIMD